MIAVGMRVDLVLIEGDPLRNISATRNVIRAWNEGIEHAAVAGEV